MDFIIVLLLGPSPVELLLQPILSIIEKLGLTVQMLFDTVTPIFKPANVIISSFAKFEGVTRYPFPWELVSHVLVENLCYIAGEEGHLLEILLCRAMIKSNGRISACCPPLSNILDLGRWLDAKVMNVKTAAPISQRRVILGYPLIRGKNPFQFEIGLNRHIKKLLGKSSRSPAVIVCSTRKTAEITAAYMAKVFNSKQHSSGLYDHSIAYFYPGMKSDDRKMIEKMFKEGLLKALCITQSVTEQFVKTECLIVKGTKKYSANGYIQMTCAELDNLIDQYTINDNSTAFIMTSFDTKKIYEKSLDNQVLESRLHSHIQDALMVGILLGDIFDQDSAEDWVHITFMSSKIRLNPEEYNLGSLTPRDHQLKCTLDITLLGILIVILAWISQALSPAMELGLIEMQPGRWRLSQVGRYAVINRLSWSSISIILKSLDGPKNHRDILEQACKAIDEDVCKLYHGDKLYFNRIAKEGKFRYPLVNKITQSWQKAFITTQMVLNQVNEDCQPAYTVRRSQSGIMDAISRVMICLAYVYLGRHQVLASKRAFELAGAINGKTWHENCFLQIEGIGPANAAILNQANKKTMADLYTTDAATLEVILKRNPPFGRVLLDKISHIPRLNSRIDHAINGVELTVTLEIAGSCQGYFNAILLVVHQSREDYVIDDFKEFYTDFNMKFTIKIGDWSNSKCLEVSLICTTHAGCNLQETIINSNPSSIQQAHHKHLSDIECLTIEGEGQQQQKVPHQVIYEKKNQTPSPMSMATNSVPKTTTSCRHTCRNREKCKHLCCKDSTRSRLTIPDVNSDKTKSPSQRFTSALKHLEMDEDTDDIQLKVRSTPVEAFINFIQGFSSRYQ